MTLTRCDLFFADKAILVEGLSERLMLPVIVAKLEVSEPESSKLSSQYVTVMEVGGAHAHLFFDLLRFLELRSLIITDLDAVDSPRGKACPVHRGTYSSNACLKAWFSGEAPFTLAGLLAKKDSDKILKGNRIAYQCAEVENGPCGRTFEDAFILTNPKLFGLVGKDANSLEIEARSKAEGSKKSEFALKYSISNTDWTSPKYIVDGVRWLASEGMTSPDPALALAKEVSACVVEGEASNV